MTNIASAFQSDPQTRRALGLDTLAAVVRIDRRDRLVDLLTDDDVETLKDLAREGMGKTPCTRSPPTWPNSRPGRPWLRERPCPGRPPRLWRSNSWRTTSGTRLSGSPATAMACRSRSATPYAPTACCEPRARTRRPPAPRELVDVAPLARGSRAHSPPLSCLSIRLGRTKTAEADDDAKALMIGPPVVAIKAWIARARIGRIRVFRAIDRLGTFEDGR